MVVDSSSADVCRTCGSETWRNDTIFKTTAVGEHPLVSLCIYCYIVSLPIYISTIYCYIVLLPLLYIYCYIVLLPILYIYCYIVLLPIMYIYCYIVLLPILYIYLPFCENVLIIRTAFEARCKLSEGQHCWQSKETPQLHGQWIQEEAKVSFCYSWLCLDLFHVLPNLCHLHYLDMAVVLVGSWGTIVRNIPTIIDN